MVTSETWKKEGCSKMKNWFKRKNVTTEAAPEEKSAVDRMADKDRDTRAFTPPPLDRNAIMSKVFQKTGGQIFCQTGVAMDAEAPTSFAMDSVSSSFDLMTSEIPDTILEFFARNSFIGY